MDMDVGHHTIRAINLRYGCVLAFLATACLPAAAQQPSAAQAGVIRQACRTDYQANCAGVPTGGQAALACLQQHASRTSPACQHALAAIGSSPAPAPAAAATSPARAAQATMQPAAERWPRTMTNDTGSAVVYQPQVIAWPERQRLETRIAVGLTPKGAKAPVLGTIDVSFATETDLATRSVVLADPKLTSSRFPAADTAQAARFEQSIKDALAAMQTRRYPLDTILLSLPQSSAATVDATVKNDPPAIFVSARPASLVVFDGDPLLAPIAGSPLAFAVNTNWDVFFDAGSKAWFLLGNGGWLTAPETKGPWTPVAVLPASFSSLPNDANFGEVKKQVPARVVRASDVPAIFVSTSPAEIIVTAGPPAYVAIPGTNLQYVANTDAALFRDTADGRHFYLVSGRWFAAPRLEGPWSFATNILPADFARIPAAGPRGFVLASVPGTTQAQQAVIEAQIPHQASLDRNTAKLTVVYAGAPKFEPIAGTQMAYALNTSFDVIRIGDAYLACWQGAWFAATTPTGPWTLAASVPAVIYTIPPSSPVFRVTFVRVYVATPTYITFGYTTGYTMGYVSGGVVVYGTGWYYPPVIIAGPIPIYYPYPYSYAGAVYYNAATGAWARGGAIYGPYGGVVKGGTAYNPATGAWAHGGAVYGPNGGAGAFSAYNPSTGGYAHGSAVWGPDGGSANANWYNPRTGISGSTNQNSNAYGRWGSSTISGPNQTIHTQSQSNAQGSAGSFSSSTGAKGAGVKGAGGNSAGAVKTAGGDVYAGADGNVYKKTDSGWEKYNNGSWNPVEKPASPKNAPASQNLSGATQKNVPASQSLSGATQNRPAQGSRFEGFGQLEQDRTARSTGAARQQQWGAQREARMGGGGFRR
ncbi:MAG: hypothetical protein ABI724_03760 [Betaproteobacteria bacterium]